MFNRVQKKLTFLYTFMTGCILLFLLALIFFWNISRREQAETDAFHNLWMSVSSHMQTDFYLSDSYLSETEANNRAIIHVEENGTPFLFPGSWTPPTDRKELIRLGMKEAAKEDISPSVAPVSSSVSQTSLLHIKGNASDSYYGRLIVLPTEKGARSLLLLSYITPRSALILQTLPLFALSGILGVMAILIISWFLTGRALNPAREGVKKQADFIAAASHELRSPLAVIRSSISAAGEEVDSSENRDILKKLLFNMDRESRRMARLVSDMLLLASSDAGNWSLKKSVIDVDTLMIETYETFLPLCREKQIHLNLDLPEEKLPQIHADRQRLEQILTILLDNAVSYTPDGHSITMRLYEQQGNHRISSGYSKIFIEILDSGNGIPDQMKAHIFERFYRGDASRTDKKHFGLGLSIAKELVVMHGGSISVKDRAEGGSRFIVSLPV